MSNSSDLDLLHHHYNLQNELITNDAPQQQQLTPTISPNQISPKFPYSPSNGSSFTAIKASTLQKPASKPLPTRTPTFGPNYGKKYIHWTDIQVEKLSAYLKDHVSFATSPCIEACELIKLKIFPNDDEITPKRLFGKICNMRAAYRRSGGVKDEVMDASGRKRRKRRHYQMDNIYSQFEFHKDTDEKKPKRKIGAIDYDDYDDDNDENVSFSDNPSIDDQKLFSAEKESKPISRATSEGLEESLEQRAIDEELLQLTTKKRGRPSGKRIKYSSNPSATNIPILPAPSSEPFDKVARFRRKPGLSEMLKEELAHTSAATDPPPFADPSPLSDMMLGLSRFDIEGIEQEMALVAKLQQKPAEASRIYDLYPELKSVLAGEPAEPAEKPKTATLQFDKITGDLATDLAYLEQALETQDLDPKMEKSLGLVGNMNKALVQQLRAWQDVAAMSGHIAGDAATVSETQQDPVAATFNLVAQKLKMDYMTTRSLVHAASGLLFKDQRPTDCSELYAKATLLSSYTQLLASRLKAAALRRDYVARIAEAARLRTQDAVARTEERKLRAAEAEAMATHAAVSRDEARMRAEESRLKALEAKMKAREWKCRTKFEVQSEKDKLEDGESETSAEEV